MIRRKVIGCNLLSSDIVTKVITEREGVELDSTE